MEAYDRGLKGITVFRPTELRGAVIVNQAPKKVFTTVFPTIENNCVNGLCSM